MLLNGSENISFGAIQTSRSGKYDKGGCLSNLTYHGYGEKMWKVIGKVNRIVRVKKKSWYMTVARCHCLIEMVILDIVVL